MAKFLNVQQKSAEKNGDCKARLFTQNVDAVLAGIVNPADGPYFYLLGPGDAEINTN